MKNKIYDIHKIHLLTGDDKLFGSIGFKVRKIKDAYVQVLP